MAKTPAFAPTAILVVENEAIVRLELVHWLTEMGLMVFAAGNADDAIKLLDDHSEIDCLMTDIKMPGSMDGLRLAHHVRDRWPPLGIIVASGMIATRPCHLPSGAIFLPKPFERQGLWAAFCQLREARGETPVGVLPF